MLPDYEIVIVDNASAPEDAAKLTALKGQDRVRIVNSRFNTGFAGGNMLGVQAASPAAEYYFFLNSDCLLLNDVCSILTKYMDEHPDTGLCTGQTYDGSMAYHTAFSYFPSLASKLFGSGIARIFAKADFPDKKVQYTEPLKVPVITGSSMFVRAAAFNQLGGLDIIYFLYCEEEDICLRMRRAGFNAAIVPAARIQHLMGGSTIRNYDVEKEFYISLNHYYRKHAGHASRFILNGYFFLKQLRKIFRGKIHGRLAMFILRGAPVRESLRFKQRIR